VFRVVEPIVVVEEGFVGPEPIAGCFAAEMQSSLRDSYFMPPHFPALKGLATGSLAEPREAGIVSWTSARSASRTRTWPDHSAHPCRKCVCLPSLQHGQ
jgi:hypothetical protein